MYNLQFHTSTVLVTKWREEWVTKNYTYTEFISKGNTEEEWYYYQMKREEEAEKNGETPEPPQSESVDDELAIEKGAYSEEVDEFYEEFAQVNFGVDSDPESIDYSDENFNLYDRELLSEEEDKEPIRIIKKRHAPFFKKHGIDGDYIVEATNWDINPHT
jgi:hypothetical protein